MKVSHAFIVAVIANIVGAIIYDYAKSKAQRHRL